jgi:uncharacterized membrane protein (GlpM family)
MTGAPSPRAPPAAPARAAPAPLLRTLGVVLMAVPAAGVAAHVVCYLALDADGLRAYVFSPWMKVLAVLAFFNLVASWFHYRKTRMGLALASRVMTYVWVISMIVLLRATQGGSWWPSL